MGRPKEIIARPAEGHTVRRLLATDHCRRRYWVRYSIMHAAMRFKANSDIETAMEAFLQSSN